MKFLKNNLKLIIAFILGVILTGGIVYAAVSAREVSYTTDKNINIKNVAEALNDLYNKKTQKVIIGSEYSNNSHEFDVTMIPNYQNLTKDNFYLNKVSIHYFNPTSGTEKNYSSNSTIPNTDIISYDQASGKLTVDASMVQWGGSVNVSVCMHYEVVCIYSK